jgi:hypothetical protein
MAKEEYGVGVEQFIENVVLCYRRVVAFGGRQEFLYR